MQFLTATKIGLLLNVIGVVMVAFSFRGNLRDAHLVDEVGREIYPASFPHPFLLRCGLVIIILGFVLQFLF